MKAFSKASLLAIALLVGASNLSNAQVTAISNISEVNAPETPSTNIRYVDMDIITEGFVLAVEFQQWMKSTSDSMKTVVEEKYKAAQKLEASIQSKLNNNKYASRPAYEKDVKKYQDMLTDIQVLEKKLSEELQFESAKRAQTLQDSIESYLKEYNVIHRYDAILYKSAGLFFNPALDITDDVLRGLNSRYSKPVEVEIPLPDGGLEPQKMEDNTITP